MVHHKKSRSLTHKARKTHPGLSFAAKDAHHHPKNHFWYIGIGLLGLAGIALLYQAGEYLLMVGVVALLLAMFRLAHVEPSQRQVRLTDRGLYWGDEFLPYFHLRAFWVAETEGLINVYIERLNTSPTLHFLIPSNRLEELVSFLSDHLPWHSHRNEPVSDRLGRLLRF